MIKLPKDMTINKERPSTVYSIVTGIAIYHLLILVGFALSSFITMENQFKLISFFDWPEFARFAYVVFYFPVLVVSYAINNKSGE